MSDLIITQHIPEGSGTPEWRRDVNVACRIWTNGELDYVLGDGPWAVVLTTILENKMAYCYPTKEEAIAGKKRLALTGATIHAIQPATEKDMSDYSVQLDSSPSGARDRDPERPVSRNEIRGLARDVVRLEDDLRYTSKDLHRQIHLLRQEINLVRAEIRELRLAGEQR